MSACVAPKVELYTQLVCRAKKPEYTTGRLPLTTNTIRSISSSSGLVPYTTDSGASNDAFKFLYRSEGDEDVSKNPCASDPEIQAFTAQLIAGNVHFILSHSSRLIELCAISYHHCHGHSQLSDNWVLGPGQFLQHKRRNDIDSVRIYSSPIGLEGAELWESLSLACLLRMFLC